MLFSIIIPCYNVAEYLKSTLDSIVNQEEFTDYEIIVIDDASTDNTKDVIIDYKERFHDLVFVHNEINSGVSYSRNRGIKISKGKYLLFLDGDDIYSSRLLISIQNCIELNKSPDMISFGFTKESGQNSVDYSNTKYNNKIFDRNAFLELYMQREIVICMCSFCIKRDIVTENEISFDTNTYAGEDQEFQIKSIMHSNQVCYLSECLFIYKYRPGSFMNRKFNKSRITALNVYPRMVDFFVQRKVSYKMIKLLNNYSLLEFFSILKTAVRANDKSSVNEILQYSAILKADIIFDYTKQSIIVHGLKLALFLNKKILFVLLKNI